MKSGYIDANFTLDEKFIKDVNFMEKYKEKCEVDFLPMGKTFYFKVLSSIGKEYIVRCPIKSEKLQILKNPLLIGK